ncbi:MAG: DUF1285 domain-containing protein [Pseudomonadota bacterium]
MADGPLKSSPETAPDTLKALNELIRTIAPDGLDGKTLPPVHLWHPANLADIGMEIRADGSWWHAGTKFNRMKLVKLFSRILRKDEDGRTYLVTPHEKVIVHVEDAPFLAVRVDRAGEPGRNQSLVFTTNLDEFTVASAETPLDIPLAPGTLEPAPYVNVRARLMAKLTRPTYYELAEMAVPSDDDLDLWGVWSRGCFFPIGPAA